MRHTITTRISPPMEATAAAVADGQGAAPIARASVDVFRIEHHSEETDCDACGRPLDVGDLAYPEAFRGDDPIGRIFCGDTCRTETHTADRRAGKPSPLMVAIERRRRARAAVTGGGDQAA